MTKQQLRKQYIAKRQQLSVVEYDELNRQLLQQFQQVDLNRVKCIHLFLPIKGRKEPDTFLIREWLKGHQPQTKLVFPKTDFDTHTMQSFADDDALQLAVNAFGIPEPVAGNEVPVNKIDLMVIPLLAFNKQGYRVGYGKGFYDRFMAKCKPGTKFIGLSFFDPVDAIDDIDEYDIRMHACITPIELYRWQ